MGGIGKAAARLLRTAKRWRWAIAAVLVSLLMDYVLLWMDNPLMEAYFGAAERAVASYFMLVLVFFALASFVIYELRVEVRSYYVCEDCRRNFSLDGHREDHHDARCPFCSSKRLNFVATVEKREGKGKRVPSRESGAT